MAFDFCSFHDAIKYKKMHVGRTNTKRRQTANANEPNQEPTLPSPLRKVSLNSPKRPRNNGTRVLDRFRSGYLNLAAVRKGEIMERSKPRST